MRNSTKLSMAAAALVGSFSLVTSPALAQHAGGGHVGGGHVGPAGHFGGVAHSGDWHGGAGGWHGGPGGWHGGPGGWHGGWGGWHGGWRGWRGGWGCCGWRGAGWGWGWGPGWWAWPWYWGPNVIVDEPVYDYEPVPGYAAPPPSAGGPPPQDSEQGPPPPTGQNFNCTAWRWDASANKYVQVPAACS